MSNNTDVLILVNKIYTLSIFDEPTRVWVDEITVNLDGVEWVHFHPHGEQHRNNKWSSTRDQFIAAIAH